MITFAFKSALCLAALIGFYHFFLRNIKAFNFNRVYLVFSLIFAVTIPFVNIRVNTSLPLNSNIQSFSTLTNSLIQGENIITETGRHFKFQDVLLITYFTVSSILFLRFALNIYKIRTLIRTSKKVNDFNVHIVLIEKQTLPYSFFQYIFVTRSDYENGKIAKEILIHEQTHCLQYHSIDILLIELSTIVLWFNPLLWILRKTIQLNHEFLADHKVLADHDLSDYQNTLIKCVFRNNSIYLASNFNYSLTKKRLIMMTKNNSYNRSVLIKIAVIPLVLILALALSLAQDKIKKEQNEETTDKIELAFSDELKAAEEQTNSFQEELKKEREAAAKEQTASFQEGLTNERATVTKEQKASFQEKLADERKAAAEGTIIIGQ